jgi:transposase-like protein
MKNLSIDSIARAFGCTPLQVRKQFQKNALQLTSMAEKAEKTGRIVNGFNSVQLREMASKVAARAK